MQTYISFLRGVNMTGHNSMKMNDLLQLYIELGFEDAETFIQSGNVIFRSASENPEHSTADKIEKSIIASKKAKCFRRYCLLANSPRTLSNSL